MDTGNFEKQNAVPRQTRIFVPRDDHFNHPNWAETVYGRIIRPMVDSCEEYLEWFWFTRYATPKAESSGDCDINQIQPAERFVDPQTGHYHSIRFRYCMPKERVESFECECGQLIGETGYSISDFRDYDYLADLGGQRHLEEPRTRQRIQERADLVANHYFSIARLILHSLSGPDSDGRFQLPHQRNPGSETPFHVCHHIFCNATDVPLYVHCIVNVPGNPPKQIVRRERVHF